MDMDPFDQDDDRRGFGKHVKLSDEELVALVDLVRPVFAKNDGGPIYAIVERKNGVIWVESGSNQGPLAGSGRFVEVRRKSGGEFELVGNGVGIWMN